MGSGACGFVVHVEGGQSIFEGFFGLDVEQARPFESVEGVTDFVALRVTSEQTLQSDGGTQGVFVAMLSGGHVGVGTPYDVARKNMPDMPAQYREVLVCERGIFGQFAEGAHDDGDVSRRQCRFDECAPRQTHAFGRKCARLQSLVVFGRAHAV